jgi:hypothetical protein
MPGRVRLTSWQGVHFLRFELDTAMVTALRSSAPLAAGIDHDACRRSIAAVPDARRDSLAGDLERHAPDIGSCFRSAKPECGTAACEVRCPNRNPSPSGQ